MKKIILLFCIFFSLFIFTSCFYSSEEININSIVENIITIEDGVEISKDINSDLISSNTNKITINLKENITYNNIDFLFFTNNDIVNSKIYYNYISDDQDITDYYLGNEDTYGVIKDNFITYKINLYQEEIEDIKKEHKIIIEFDTIIDIDFSISFNK